MNYTVKPFSGKNYHRNATKCRDTTNETPCAICGKPVKDPWPHQACVIAGGARWGDVSSDHNDPGYMGWWPVGSDCHRKHAIGRKPCK